MARRLAAAVVLLVLTLAATGCEDAGQRGARRVLQSQLRARPGDGGYRVTGVHCTRGARVVLDPVRTTRYLCTAPRRSGGDCDWFRVDARFGRPPAIVRIRLAAGCVLPGE